MAVHEFPRSGELQQPASPEKLTAQRARLADFDLFAPPGDVLERRAPDFGALVRPRTLLEIAAQMSLGERAQLEFHRGEKGWSFELAAFYAGIGAAEDESGFEALLGAVAPKARFCRDAPSPKPCAAVVQLAPQPAMIEGSDEKPLWLPPIGWAQSDLTLALKVAFDLPVEALVFNIRPIALSETVRAQLTAASYRLADKAASSRTNEVEQAFIAGWLAAGRGCDIAVEIACARKLTDQELNALSLALFGCVRHVGAAPGIDLRLALPRGTLPLWRFWPIAADLRRYNLLDFHVPIGNGALALGADAAGRPVRMAQRDRPYHTFVCGVTGSGKSTLIGNACREDIENGEGVLLIDPHGNLARKVRASVPQRRQRDLIWIDLGDEDLAWRLDLFNTPGIFPDAERDRIASHLIDYFRQTYAGVPEAFGPMFDNLFRGTILLLHSAKDEADRTLLKFRKVLVDAEFREKLLEECEDEIVIELWQEIQRVRGDWNLDNLAPYITCKLNHLTGPLMRRFIGGDKPRLDLRRAMDERRIVILNLNKAAMSDLGARLAGALVLMALNEAAMGRSAVPEETHIPFRVYCDEFQTMACKQAAVALAECRKFNIALLLANQNLGQLRGDSYGATDVSETVLANCNSLIALRTGIHDAKLLAPLLGLEDHRELVDLGVGEMIVRRLANGFPAAAQRIYGFPPMTQRPAPSANEP